MAIEEYHLIIDDGTIKKELIYRGNENIIIKSTYVEKEDGAVIPLSRHILEKFIEMINGN